MRSKSLTNFTPLIRRIAALIMLSLFFGIVSGAVHAVTTDFDDLTYVPVDPEWPQFGDHPLGDEYLSQGLIEGGFLSPYYSHNPDIVSAPNFLFGSNFMRLIFTDAPTYVSMYVNSVFDYANILHVYGSDGLISRTLTSGSSGTEPNTPHIPWEFVSFSAPNGITRNYSGRFL